jgi:DNA-binding GntR family transcriptional regulator
MATLTARATSGQGAASSLVDEAYRALKAAIRENVFPPGYQAAEPEIAQQLGMSRTPVHEAIIRLQEEGLVQVLSRRGVVVCAIAPSDMREIYDVTIALEGMAASLLAQQATDARPGAVTALEDETASMAAALEKGDLLGWAAADDRFHQQLTRLCGNRRLARMASTVMDQSHRARLLTLHLRPPPVSSAAEHRRITDAIRHGDPAGAEAAAKLHRTRARDALMPLLEQYGMRNL